MASTRNRNTPGDYASEQKSMKDMFDSILYENGSSAQAYQTNFAGNGLLNGRMASCVLSHNACDVESFLYGIGSTNLVNPYQAPTPDIKHIPSLNIMNKLPVIVPNPLVIHPNQRPRPL